MTRSFITGMELPAFHSLAYYKEHLESGETLIFGVPIFLLGVYFMYLFFQGLHPGVLEITPEQDVYLACGFILVCIGGITPLSRVSDVLPHRHYSRLKEYYQTRESSEEFTLLTSQRLIHREPAIADPVLYSWTWVWQWLRIWNKQLELELSEPLARLSSIEIMKVKPQTMIVLWTTRKAPEGYPSSGWYARHVRLSNAYPILLFFASADHVHSFLTPITQLLPNLLVEGHLH